MSSVQEIGLTETNTKPVFRTDKLSGLDKRERKVLMKVFNVINKALDSERAEMLIQKIEAEFK